MIHRLTSEKSMDVMAIVMGIAISLLAGFMHRTYIMVLEHLKPGCFYSWQDTVMNWVCTILFGLLVGFICGIYIRVKWEQSASAHS